MILLSEADVEPLGTGDVRIQKRILVVDDDPDLREILRDRLQDWGFDVIEAANGSKGLTALERSQADAILLDISMPTMDGLTMLKHIRIRDARIPVVMMSIPENSAQLVQALVDGAHDYVLKPLEFDQLAAKLNRLVE